MWREIYSKNGIWIWIFSPFIVQTLLIPPKMLMPLKSLHQHWGKPHGRDLKAAPFPFGVVASTGCNGISFPVIYELMDNWFVMYNGSFMCSILKCKKYIKITNLSQVFFSQCDSWLFLLISKHEYDLLINKNMHSYNNYLIPLIEQSNN